MRIGGSSRTEPNYRRQTNIGRVNEPSHDGLNPAHVPHWWVNNPAFGPCCEAVIGRADIEGSKSYVAMNAWQPQASYPCGNLLTPLA